MTWREESSVAEVFAGRCGGWPIARFLSIEFVSGSCLNVCLLEKGRGLAGLEDSGCAWPPGSSRARLACIVRAGEVPVMTGPQDPAAAGRDRLRAGHADREQVIDTLKNAFVHGPADQGRTRRASGPGAGRADLRRPGRAHRRHPGRPARSQAGAPARPGPPPAAGQGGRQVGRLPDHRGRRHVGRWLSSFRPTATTTASRAPILPMSPGLPCASPGLCRRIAAIGILGSAVVTSLEQRRSRRQLPPRPGPGHAQEAERRGGTGHGPVPPGPRTDQAQADLRAHKSREHQQHIPARAGRAPRGVRPAPGTV